MGTAKLESCRHIKRLFSTAMAKQDTVSAQKAVLQENDRNAIACSACKLDLLCRYEGHLVGFLHFGVVNRRPATPKRAC